MALSEAKRALRRSAREAASRAAGDPARDARVRARLDAVLPADGLVLAYEALADEVDLGALLDRLAAAGRLVLPRVTTTGLDLVRVTDRDALVPGPLGLREPTGPAIDAAHVAAVLVPGRAFDRAGARLGRGQGHYDRLLPNAPQAVRVGVTWEALLVPAVPTDAHDVPVDVVVTELRTAWTGARAVGPLATRDASLTDIVRLAASRPRPVAVFDVDSTLFSTAERHRRILVEVAQETGDEPLLRLALATPSATFRWSVDEPVRAAGLGTPERLTRLRTRWQEMFFDDGWCALDLPMPGAVETVRLLADAGVLVVYLTGRIASRMEQGTLALFRRWGLPLHDGRAMLVMKTDPHQPDAVYKHEALDRLAHLGDVVATWENEPGHANDFARRFPDAVHVLLDTVHTPDAPPPEAAVRVIPTW